MLEAKYIDGLLQDFNNPFANAQALLRSCTKPSIYENPLDIQLHVLSVKCNQML